MTSVPQALESLRHQQTEHERQQILLQDEQRHFKAQQERSSSVASTGVSSNASAQTSKSVDDYLKKRIPHLGCDVGETNFDRNVEKTLDDCDSLLIFLNKRGRKVEQPPSLSPVKCTLDSEANSEGRLPKSDADVIEELRVHNEALRAHVLDLLDETQENDRQIHYYRRELDHMRSENQRLRDRLNSLEPTTPDAAMDDHELDTDAYYSFPVGMPPNLDHLPSLELPPLEMPKFDFTVLQSDNHSDNNSSKPA